MAKKNGETTQAEKEDYAYFLENFQLKQIRNLQNHKLISLYS